MNRTTTDWVNTTRIFDFHDGLKELPQVKSLASYYKVTIDTIIKKLMCRVVVRRFKSNSIKRISIQFLDEPSQTLIHSVSTFNN
jgi:hypothetical protein